MKMKRSILIFVMCPALHCAGQAQAGSNPPWSVLTPMDLPKIVDFGRKAIPTLKVTYKGKTTYTGFWSNPNQSGTFSYEGSFQGELIPGGKFVLKVNPYCTPWSGGKADFYAEVQTITYDGEKTTTLVEKRGPIDGLQMANEAVIVAGDKDLQGELEQVVALQAFIGIAKFTSLGGDWADITAWPTVPNKLLQFTHSGETLEASIISSKPQDNLVPVEKIVMRLSPKLGIQKYSDIHRDEKGNIVSDYEVNVTEFNADVPGPLMFPKKVITDLKLNKDAFGRATDRHTTIDYTYDINKGLTDYGIELPDGTYLTDKRFGIQFQVSSDVSQIIESMKSP